MSLRQYVGYQPCTTMMYVCRSVKSVLSVAFSLVSISVPCVVSMMIQTRASSIVRSVGCVELEGVRTSSIVIHVASASPLA